MGFITKELSSSSLIKACQLELEVEIDDNGGDDKLFDFTDHSEVFECGEFSSPLSCVTKNKKNKIVRYILTKIKNLVTINCPDKFGYVTITEAVFVLEKRIVDVR